MPNRYASLATSMSPVSAICLTARDPNRRTSRCEPDQPGTMPSPASGSPSFTWLSQRMKAAVAASSSPPAKAWPLTTAIMGTRSRARASKARCPARVQERHISMGARPPHAAMSPPAQNALPSPHSNATRISVRASILRAACCKARIIGISSALSFSARASVIVAIAPLKVSLTRGSDMCISDMGRAPQCQADRPRLKQPRIHHLEMGIHLQREAGLRQNIARQIDPRRNLGDGDALLAQNQHAALGDIGNFLSLHQSTATGECDMLDLPDQLFDFAFLEDHQLAIGDVELGTCGEKPGEDDPFCPCGNVDKAATTGGHMRAMRELGDIDTAIAIDFE